MNLEMPKYNIYANHTRREREGASGLQSQAVSLSIPKSKRSSPIILNLLLLPPSVIEVLCITTHIIVQKHMPFVAASGFCIQDPANLPLQLHDTSQDHPPPHSHHQLYLSSRESSSHPFNGFPWPHCHVGMFRIPLFPVMIFIIGRQQPAARRVCFYHLTFLVLW